MTADDKLKHMIGNLLVQNVLLQHQLEEERAKQQVQAEETKPKKPA